MIQPDFIPKNGTNWPFVDLTVKIEVLSPKTFSIPSQQPLFSKSGDIKTRSTSASLSYIGQVTKYTIVK